MNKMATRKKVAKKKPGRKSGELTAKEVSFLYNMPACDFVQLAAMRKAGYKGTEGSLAVTANRVLKKAKARRLLEKITNDYLQDSKLAGEKVVKRLAILGTTTVANLYTEDDKGILKLKSFKEMGEHVAAINKIKTTTKTIGAGETEVVVQETQIETVNPVKPLELVGQNAGKFNKALDVNITGSVPVTDNIDLSALSDEELRTMLELQKKARSGNGNSNI